MCEALRKAKLRKLKIDAPTLGEALEKLRTVCRATPGTGDAFLKWPFFEPKLATLGPVHFELQEGRAADALFPMIFNLGCKFSGRPDGSCGITARQMSDGPYFNIREWKLPASLIMGPPKKITRPQQPKASASAKTDMIVCGGMTFGQGEFAMYSKVSESLVVKETAEGFLKLRKGLYELWLKAGYAPAPQK